MRSFGRLSALALLMGFFSFRAQAGLLLEPAISYETGSVIQLESAGTGIDNGGKTTGTGVGLRAGYKLPLFLWFALDYRTASGATYKGLLAGDDGKVDRSDLYFDVGVDLPILARVWAGYGLANSAKNKTDSGNEGTFKEGSNMKVGIGFKFIPFVSLNFEYFMHDYKSYEDNTGTIPTSDNWKTHKESGVLVGLSVPFNL